MQEPVADSSVYTSPRTWTSHSDQPAILRPHCRMSLWASWYLQFVNERHWAVGRDQHVQALGGGPIIRQAAGFPAAHHHKHVTALLPPSPVPAFAQEGLKHATASPGALATVSHLEAAHGIPRVLPPSGRD